jgi:hypothetical protein
MHSNAKKYKHKVTPEVYKEIKKIAGNLSQVPALDKHNKPVYKMETRILKGDQFPEGKKDRNGKPYDKNSYYSMPSEPQLRLQNHEVALVNAYELFAWKGVDAYIKSVEQYVKVLDEASKLAEKLKAEKAIPGTANEQAREVFNDVMKDNGMNDQSSL